MQQNAVIFHGTGGSPEILWFRGAALLLAILEHLDTTVAQAILVAGYSTKPDNSSEPVLQESYDWAAIRSHVRDDGHFGDDDQPYPEFPLVDRLIP